MKFESVTIIDNSLYCNRCYQRKVNLPNNRNIEQKRYTTEIYHQTPWKHAMILPLFVIYGFSCWMRLILHSSLYIHTK